MLSFPFEDPIVVVKITGKALWEALENGLRNYPDMEKGTSCIKGIHASDRLTQLLGTMLQVSGIFYTFNPNAKSGERVQSVKLGDADIDMEKKYTVACRSRLGFGQGICDKSESKCGRC